MTERSTDRVEDRHYARNRTK